MRIRQTPRGSVLCEAAVRVNAQTQNEANPLKKLIRTDMGKINLRNYFFMVVLVLTWIFST
jgi:hypothetical protein